MKVILTEKVNTLGNIGEIVNVSAGHARNFLIPNKLAVLADEKNSKQLDHQKKVLAKKMEEQKNEALGLKSKVDGLVVELVKKVGANGKLFGTVTTAELSKELLERGVEVERRLMTVSTQIKTIGTFDVKAKLFQDVEANFQVKVVMDEKQAEELKAKQAAAEKRAAEKKKKKAEAADSEQEEKTEEESKSSEEKLSDEANEILRS